MPDQREYRVVRESGPYRASNIVCDYCFRPLNRNFYYEVYEGDTRPNPYPFHTVDCADRFVRERIAHRNVLVDRCSNEFDDTQEEATTD